LQGKRTFSDDPVTMRLKTIASIAMCAVFAPISPRDAQIDPALAKRYFREAQWASDDDGGKLWGTKLYGPTLFFDPATGDTVANQADGEKKLTAKDGLFVGMVPKDFAGANTALDWSGVPAGSSRPARARETSRS